MARLRGLGLVVLALLGLPLAVLDLAALIFGVSPVVLGIRRLPVLARRLAGEWCEVPIAEPYDPMPGPPRPRPDGLYEVRRRLYRRPYVPVFWQQVHWLAADGATWLDLLWLVVNPLGGTVLGLVAAVAGKPGLRWHGRWTRALLGARRPWPNWVRDRTLLVLDGAQLAAVAVAGLLLVVVQLAAGVLALAGVSSPLIVLVENSRTFVNYYRRRIGGIDEPYRPVPAPPRPEADGRYRVRRRVYRSPAVPTRLARLSWLARDPASGRDLLWMVLNPLVTVTLLALPCAALLLGFAQVTTTVTYLWHHTQPGWQVPAGALATAVVLMVAPTLRRWHDRWTRVLLAPTEAARLAKRVERLTETRADAVDTQAAELRRIERDLHDGAQGRLVAMGMALRTVERLLDADPELARKLIVEVRENTATALTEIRELVHGIHPPVLAERGLADAIRVVALDSPLDVAVAADLPGRLDPPVESAAYFAVRELLTNAAKHSGADKVRVDVSHAGGLLRIVVYDDGHGGAHLAGGTGLLGVRRRLGTFDGVLDVRSPVGGPTTLTMEIPCVLSSRRTSTSSGPD
ncbi:sensor histidine kinase [Kutzneria sp. CA-103260]|uniref:sensor histidine kinase n=1 Tax=Kutzneria sp. CA-103260 TaxID=2802641 RepID=UPI001BA6C552|nr:histidine kinase [Kutzneria sp. CA-103260]QUQ68516.1 two-component system histidine kinase [Kutzneria sp. CA-103260]